MTLSGFPSFSLSPPTFTFLLASLFRSVPFSIYGICQDLHEGPLLLCQTRRHRRCSLPIPRWFGLHLAHVASVASSTSCTSPRPTRSPLCETRCPSRTCTLSAPSRIEMAIRPVPTFHVTDVDRRSRTAFGQRFGCLLRRAQHNPWFHTHHPALGTLLIHGRVGDLHRKVTAAARSRSRIRRALRLSNPVPL